MRKILYALLLLLPLSLIAQTQGRRWSETEINKWYKQQGWLRGSNFIPSTAINQLEMWQKETFDTATIDRELGWAHQIGLNCMRVFLHHAAWQQDPAGFKDRIYHYLSIAAHNQIRTIFVFFDDCWNESYHTGTQPTPKTGVHNSGWVRDPGALLYSEPLLRDTLEKYVKDILSTFRSDERIVFWDLYNEPGNSGYGNKSLPLLQNVFEWARSVALAQPVSAGLYDPTWKDINRFLLEHADVISYHDYQARDKHQLTIDSLQHYNRPLICTEYMARTRNSTFATIFPLLKAHNIGAINWGLVSGKTNTIYAWDTPMPDGKVPTVWFHDIFRQNGTPYDETEIKLIKKLTIN